MSEPNLHDDEILLAQLSAALDEGDPIPAAAIELAVAGFQLRDVDEQLAQLVEDSSVGPAMVFRDEAVVTRALSFSVPSLTIEVEVDEREGVVIGMLSPPSSTTIEVETVRVHGGRRDSAVRSDELGRFRVAVGQGLCRLRCHPAGPVVITPWFSL